ncbi:unnamed protein product (macronuclear) [Paramecium tetraurelia]|uniref:Uncharacterized protein n=1 Tax=Paramecium tetraurelia TaxID=5888 RepID=A0C4F1_PARTE|nr:uncharacterized protein GSPATT00035148001 [Paramecium tetraurelia]CAK65668.1 unnamed protein product [Paramecium tetraurelia]|eukprot:XP_001433065.1 hypothetical protein (macronuclear) [Paramecium tetraurelia strain d4-2]
MDKQEEKLQQEEKEEVVEEQDEKQGDQLSKNQKRNQKKKEKKKKLKEQNQEIIQQVEEEIKAKLNLTEAEQTDLEIAWCVKQVKLGLTQKLTPEEIKISMSMIELLESDQVPLVKKRMAMKSSFGDYRKLMKQYK